jgi:hypothetical protein
MKAVDRRWLWLVDHSPHALGLAGLLLGATVAPALLPLGWVALGVALFAWLAEAEGFALPRPGRRPIVGYGCYEIPQAFAVRLRGRYLLFSRDEDPGSGGWAAEYTVRELPGLDAAGLRGLRGAFPNPTERPGATLAQVPVAALRFEHRERASYVVSASLVRALNAAG